MPVIYYSYYTPVSDSISDISKQEHMLGHYLLVQGLRELYHLSLSTENLSSVLKTDCNGKPYLSGHPEICFNITHCDGFVACAFHTKAIGIDAEFPGYFPPILVEHALSEDEKSLLQSHNTDLLEQQEWFYRLWTLKEAYVKESGVGVDIDLTSVSFSFSEQSNRFSCSDSSIVCYQTTLCRGHILSLCYESPELPVTLVSCSLQHEPPR